MSKIKELPKSSSHLLQCTQIITSVQTVVKELIENAIDSSSKNIEVKLDNYGLDKIEVKDSGSGICKDDIGKVCKPHCTSKISSHSDLNQIQTYGFRGEALAALCAVSDLAITTKTAEEQFGFAYVFGKNGEIVSAKPYPCTQGTTVASSNLFKNIPVRKQYYRTDKIKKEELKKIEDMLYAFGCIHTDIRFALFHNKSLIWQKPVVSKVREGLVSVFGSSVVDHMQNCEFSDDKEQVKIEVFLPKGNAPAFCSNTSSNRSIISINKRPVRMKVLDRVLKQCFSKSLMNLTKSRYPICYISIEVPPCETDVNIEPNKTAVVLHNMDIVTKQLTAILETFYENDTPNAVEADSEAKKSELATKAKVMTLEPPLKRSEINIISSQNNLSQMMKLQNNKDKCLERKKLSKPPNVQEPSAKKFKASNSKANDIFQHIKTMDSFFMTANSSEVRNPDTESTLFSNNSNSIKESSTSQLPLNGKELSINSSAQVKTTTLLPSAVSNMPGNMYSPDNELNKIPLSNTNHHFTPATAERNQLNSISSPEETICTKSNFLVTNLNENSLLAKSNLLVADLNINSLPEKNHSLVNNSNKYSMPEKNNTNCHINNVDFNNLFNLGDLTSEHFAPCVVNAPVNDNDNSALDLNDALNFQTAKLILEKNQNILSFNEQQPCKNTVSENSSLPTSENQISSNVTASQNWSRGKHAIQDMQPVAVLMPQIVENSSKNINDKEIIFKEKTKDSKILNNSVSNQRKMTAFDFFCRKNRLEIASLNPEMTNHQIAQILTEKWSNLSIEEKSIYKNMIDKTYPKNIKNKEKLGNCVKQNLNKIKGTPTKRKSKMRRKCMERIITLDLQTPHNYISSSSSNLGNINIISCIAPGIWIFSQDNKLCILNTFRLQEMVIYHRLLNTFRFEPEQLEFPCIISNDSLGEEASAFISQLPKKECYMAETIVDERIIANGFELNLLKSQEEVQIQVVGMTKNIAFYSVLDLKEILLLLKEKGPCAKLSECRPGKVILFLQSEAVRMARQCPTSKSIQDVEDLLISKELLPSNCDMCIHSKPFIHEIATL